MDQLTPVTRREGVRFVLASLLLLLLCVPSVYAQQSGSQNADASAADTSGAPATYTVQDDDTLYNISRRFGTSVRQLMRWNNLDSAAIKIGQTLQVRPPDRPDTSIESSSTGSGSTESASGNGLSSSGQKDSTVESDVERNNQSARRSDGRRESTAGRTSSGRTSSRSVPSRRAPARGRSARDTPPGTIQAQSNDTFVDLAIRYGTTADTLFALNDSLRAPLPPGRVIQFPDRYGPPSHVVKEGDTMYSIAGEYGVSIRALQDANDLQNTSIQPGQKLRVPNRAPSSPESSRSPHPDTTGAVALYPAVFSGRLTASGTAYDPDTFVGSHPSLPYGSVVLLSHPGTRNHCFVEIIDRGPLEDDVLMDVSDAVARQLGVNPNARTLLELRVIWVER